MLKLAHISGLHIAGWQPLNGERWPRESMRVHSIVKEGRMFLPNFVFLEDTLLFDFIHIIN
jgi:hypothetical protein